MERINVQKASKVLMWMLIALYVISPMDFMSGFVIDDALVAALGAYATYKMGRS